MLVIHQTSFVIVKGMFIVWHIPVIAFSNRLQLLLLLHKFNCSIFGFQHKRFIFISSLNVTRCYGNILSERCSTALYTTKSRHPLHPIQQPSSWNQMMHILTHKPRCHVIYRIYKTTNRWVIISCTTMDRYRRDYISMLEWRAQIKAGQYVGIYYSVVISLS